MITLFRCNIFLGFSCQHSKVNLYSQSESLLNQSESLLNQEESLLNQEESCVCV